jgi:protein disulfide isomerase family A protein 3
MIVHLLCGLATLALAASASDVLVLTESNFDSEIAPYPVILIEFYAPWCGHCKALAPEYEKAATELKSNDPAIPLAKVDCTVEKNVCQKYGVSGYPTLKIFKSGEFAAEYNGPREANGIVSYMRKKAAPPSKKLNNTGDLKNFKALKTPTIIGFLKEGSPLDKAFHLAAEGLSEDLRFAHAYDSDVLKSAGMENEIVIYQPKHLHNKFEPSKLAYSSKDTSSGALKSWIEKNIMGLAGHRTMNNHKYFSKRPLVMAYYKVDYEKNPKGTNYWRNRVMKVATEVLKATGKDCQFSVSNVDDMQDISEYGFENAGESDKVRIVARDSADKKYSMTEEFSMETFKKWLTSFVNGNEEPYIKSEAVPTPNTDPVKVVVAKNFEEIVNQPDKDVLIEFYAPWCGHCKALAPKFDELGKKLEDEPNIVIAKMDATANDVPPYFEVTGFPTLYFVPKNSKKSPKKYSSGREVNDFIKYIAAEATTELKGYDRQGNSRAKTDL